MIYCQSFTGCVSQVLYKNKSICHLPCINIVHTCLDLIFGIPTMDCDLLSVLHRNDVEYKQGRNTYYNLLRVIRSTHCYLLSLIHNL